MTWIDGSPLFDAIFPICYNSISGVSVMSWTQKTGNFLWNTQSLVVQVHPSADKQYLVFSACVWYLWEIWVINLSASSSRFYVVGPNWHICERHIFFVACQKEENKKRNKDSRKLTWRNKYNPSLCHSQGPGGKCIYLNLKYYYCAKNWASKTGAYFWVSS